MLSTLFSAASCIVSRFFLRVMGWSLLDPRTGKLLLSEDRVVMIYPHTSYADFYIFLLYRLAHPIWLGHIKMLVKPQPFVYAGWLLRKFGAIPATKVDEKRGGAVQRITENLSRLNRFLFLISPKGTILNKPWRSGYYHIAKELNAKILVGGLDYEKKSVVILPGETYTTETEEDTRDHLQQKISEIVPLFPEGEVVKVRPHNAKKRTLADWMYMIGSLFTMYSIYFMCSGYLSRIRSLGRRGCDRSLGLRGCEGFL